MIMHRIWNSIVWLFRTRKPTHRIIRKKWARGDCWYEIQELRLRQELGVRSGKKVDWYSIDLTPAYNRFWTYETASEYLTTLLTKDRNEVPKITVIEER
jgi:hypothetical protein